MIIGITGYSGVLGRELHKELSQFKKFNIIKFENNILDKKKVKQWIQANNFEVIIHLAAVVPIQKFNKSNIASSKVNFIGTKNIIDSIKYSNKKVFIFFSSTSHVYKKSHIKINETSQVKPINNYGFSKLNAEKYIIKNSKKKNYDFCIGRIFSFTSINQTKDFFIPAMFNKIRKTQKIFKVNFSNEYRDFIHLKDIVLIITRILILKKKGIYNICSGNKISIYDIIKKICKKLKKQHIFLNKKKKPIGLFGSNLKIKKFYKKSFKNIDYIINDYSKLIR